MPHKYVKLKRTQLYDKIDELEEYVLDLETVKTYHKNRCDMLDGELRTAKFKVSELEGQVVTQSNIVTTARIAAQESHKRYQDAYNRAEDYKGQVDALTYQVQSLNQIIDRMEKNNRSWWSKVWEKVRDYVRG